MSGKDGNGSEQNLNFDQLVATFSERLAQKAEDSSEKSGAASRAAFDNETFSYQRAAAEEQLRAMAANTNAKIQDTDLRKEYASRAFQLGETAVWFWICMFAAVGIANGVQEKQILSDNALMTLTAGATFNVIAVCMVVARGLFPKSETKDGE